MPFVSQAQRRFLFARHPKIAREFAEKTPAGTKLPEHVKAIPLLRNRPALGRVKSFRAVKSAGAMGPAIDEALWQQINDIMPGVVPQQLPHQVGTIDNGIKVSVVDGDQVKAELDMDFVEGANDLELIARNGSSYVPDGEIWIDCRLDPLDWSFVCYHEAVERRDLSRIASPQVADYDWAHERANRVEKMLRRRAMTGAKCMVGTPKPGPCPTGTADRPGAGRYVEHAKPSGRITPRAGGAVHAKAQKVMGAFRDAYAQAKDEGAVSDSALRHVTILANTMKQLTKKFYGALEGRYGRAAAIAIMASGQSLAWGATGAGALAGVPVWLPASTLWGALPAVAIAETLLQVGKVARAAAGKAMPAQLSREQIDTLGAALVEELTTALAEYAEERRGEIEPGDGKCMEGPNAGKPGVCPSGDAETTSGESAAPVAPEAQGRIEQRSRTEEKPLEQAAAKAPPQGEVVPIDKSAITLEHVMDSAAAHYPKAGKMVDGRKVLSKIDNTDSISAALEHYDELPGIREVDMQNFESIRNNQGKPARRYAADDERRAVELAEKIKNGGKISPLIVVDDGNPEGPWILEGGHRFDALERLGAKSFPALVIIDFDGLKSNGKEGNLTSRLASKAQAALSETKSDTLPPEPGQLPDTGAAEQQREYDTRKSTEHPCSVEPKAGGVCIKAGDTGRVLMLQRAMSEDDSAAGKWEFPGGHLNHGEPPLDGAIREWQEETGLVLPQDAKPVNDWLSPNGVYWLFMFIVPHEDGLPINQNPDRRRVVNPDGDLGEVLAWFDPQDCAKMPALRKEARSIPWDEIARTIVADS